MSKPTTQLEWLDDAGNDIIIKFPTKRAMCERCDGHGRHGHPAYDGCSVEIFRDDPNHAAEYFSGQLDVVCSECHGERIVETIDESACTPEQLKILGEYYDNERYNAQVMRAEMGWG